MSAREWLIVNALTVLDLLMDVLTFGAWSYERGNVIRNVKVKE